MKKSEFIFACKKCGHLLYVEKDKEKIQQLLKIDCPTCGENPFELWVLIGEGNYKNDFGE